MRLDGARLVLAAAVVAAATICAPGIAWAQSAGPQTPAKTPEIIRLPSNPPPDKPPVPQEELIQQFAAHQEEAAEAHEKYIARKIVLLEEMGQDGKPAGEAEMTTDYAPGEDGTLRPKTTRKPDSTLQILDLEPDTVQMLAAIPLFPFTPAEIPKYNIEYRTTQPVDDLTTYVFLVTPRQLDRQHAFFSGLIYVDDHDLAIVKMYGKWVSETGDMKPPGLPFTMFETYCQPVANKYWMPAYSRSDDFTKVGSNSMPVRLVIRWDNYRLAAKAQAAAVAASSGSAGSASAASTTTTQQTTPATTSLPLGAPPPPPN